MLKHMTAVWKYRHFLAALVRLDLRLRYRRSVFGIGWSLLNPIAMTVVFCVVFSTILGSGGDPGKYAAYLLTGLAVWGFLRDSALNGCRAFIQNEAYIRQSPLPFSLYPLRTVLGQTIHFGIALVVVVALAAIVHGAGTVLPNLWSILPGLALALVAAWAVATLTAFANVYFQDTQHLMDVGAQIMFFLTPIMYDRKVLDAKGLSWMVDLNPVNLFLEVIRNPLLTGGPPGGTALLAATLFTVAAVGLAVGTMAWLQKRVIFHL